MTMRFYDLFKNSSSESNEEYEYEHLKSIEKILEDSSDESNEFDEPTNESNETCNNTNESNFKESNKYKLINRRIDTNRIRHKIANNLEVHTSICKNVKVYNEGPIRSGAIIYTHHEGKTYFCMGIDSCYGDLTDFAGGVKKGESVLQGGLRELHEESLGVFGELRESDIYENLAFYSNNMVIMFIRLNVNMDKIKKSFIIKKNCCDNKLEVSNIYWLTKSEFLESISCKGKKMYSRVQKILSKVTEIIQAL